MAEYMKEELVKMVYSKNCFDRHIAAEHGYGLDVLVNDPEEFVRAAVARQGYGMDVLINDADWHVRLEVAKHGFGLHILVLDEDSRVRAEVAKQGYGLDLLANDDDSFVRRNVQRHLISIGMCPDYEEWLSYPLQNLNLSPRAFHCLRRADIETIGDLSVFSDSDLMKLRNMGPKILSEIKEKFGDFLDAYDRAEENKGIDAILLDAKVKAGVPMNYRCEYDMEL